MFFALVVAAGPVLPVVAFAARTLPAPSDAVTLRALTAKFLRPARSIGEPKIALPFATVTYDGTIESDSARGQLLFRKYAFGWQLLDPGYFGMRACDLRAFGIPAASIPALFAPKRSWDAHQQRCAPAEPFALPSARETAIRGVMQRY